MKREHFDPRTGTWTPVPEVDEAKAVKTEKGAETAVRESDPEQISALREKAKKLMKELSDPKVPVGEAHKMWVEYRAIQERLGEDTDKSDKERIPGYL